MTGPDNTEFDDLDDLKAAMTAATPAPIRREKPRRWPGPQKFSTRPKEAAARRVIPPIARIRA